MNLGETLSRAIHRGDFYRAEGLQRVMGRISLRPPEAEFRGMGKGKRLRVLICERDPLHFLGALAVTLRDGHHAFLANPDWKKSEWGSVNEQVRPDAIWRNGLLERCEKKDDSVDFPEGEDVYIAVPTGGTGGKVRFALHTERTLAAAVDGFRRFFGMERIHSVCLLPLFHVSGLMQVMRAVFTQGTVCFASSFLQPEKMPAIADEQAPAFLSLVPTQLRRFLGLPSALGRMRRFAVILLGGAPAAPDLLEACRKLDLRLAPTYGMTETAAAVCALRPEAFLDGICSGGEILPHARIKVVACDDGIASPSVEGRLFIESASLFKGYFPRVNLGLHAWESGDLGYFTEDGRLHVTGRVRPTINSGGEKIDPEEIEQALLATGGVEEAYVAGVPDDEWGEAVAVLFVPGKTPLDPVELTASLRIRLARYKIPKLWVPLARLPRNAQGKLDRAEIQKELSRAKQRIFCHPSDEGTTNAPTT